MPPLAPLGQYLMPDEKSEIALRAVLLQLPFRMGRGDGGVADGGLKQMAQRILGPDED